MSAVKDEVVRLIESLPDDCTIEEIQYHLYVRQKVERGLAAAEAGLTVSQEDAERRVEGWLESDGRSRGQTTSRRLSTSSRATRPPMPRGLPGRSLRPLDASLPCHAVGHVFRNSTGTTSGN